MTHTRPTERPSLLGEAPIRPFAQFTRHTWPNTTPKLQAVIPADDPIATWREDVWTLNGQVAAR